VLEDLFDRLERERQAADRQYNDALTALDQAFAPRPEFPSLPAFSDAAVVERLNREWKILPEGAPTADRSLRGRLRAFVWRVQAPTLQAQQQFNAAIVDHVNRNIAAHEEARRAALALVEAARREVEALVRFEWLLLQLLQAVTGYVDTKDRAGAAPQLREQVALIQQRLSTVERELTRSLEGRPERAATGRDTREAPPTARTPASPFDELRSAVYLGFEDRYRGSSGTIRARLEPYLPIFAGASDVLDVGCGRGELLELFRAHGIPARGIDTNQAMVDECRNKALAVERADARTHLDALADRSLGGMIAVQVVEHLEPAYLLRVLELAYHKLRPGAPLVLETINPACWMAFFECYLRDLTHVRPLHPDTLHYLVQASGFSNINVEYRQPVDEADRLDRIAPETAARLDETARAVAAAVNAHADKLNARLFSSMDYAIVARR
jgi:SAM-dependent methyltransferase